MNRGLSKAGARAWTVTGLVVGSVGIAILWLSGVPFPFAIPPGIVLLLLTACLVAFGPWRWVSAVGAVVGLFVLVGFLISPDGIPNVLGEHGTSVAIGQVIQVIGVLTAAIAGIVATRFSYRTQAR